MRLCSDYGIIRLLMPLGLLSLVSPASLSQDRTGPPIHVRTALVLDSLLHDEDTDGDRKITIDDPHIAGTGRGDKRFELRSSDGRPYEIAGPYYLANLLEELTIAADAGLETAEIFPERIFAPPLDRISRNIRTRFWAGLTRHIDEDGLGVILNDEKAGTAGGERYIYVPPSDRLASAYFTDVAARHPDWKLHVVVLPSVITPAYVRNLDGRYGILTLSLTRSAEGKVRGEPFVVPGGRFNEMYGWDSYFIVLGLLNDGQVDLARSMVNNHVYEITHYAAILNANRTYYLTRSQPPFLTSMALAVYSRLPKNAASKRWLRDALAAAITEYDSVWTSGPRMTATGLSRYYDRGYGPPPEVEPGHFDEVYARFARHYGMSFKEFLAAYRPSPVPDDAHTETGGEEGLTVPELDRYFVHDRSMRESGHDTSYRLEGRSADLVTVDLNALLYKYEADIAATIRKEFGGTLKLGGGRTITASLWEKRGRIRKDLVNRYLWDGQRGMYFDYDVRQGKTTGYVSATTLYPLWALLASPRQADTLVTRALPLLEAAGGIVASSEASRGPITPERPPRQWDYPNGWAPHQVIAWQGLLAYGYRDVAQRLAYRWLYTITLNATNYNGTVPEKFDLVTRSHLVFAEYGNVGTDFSYITREGFGWTNASYQIGLGLIDPHHRRLLNRLIPPEWVF
ncbi:MAG: trehalase family glycosidase [Bacteroidota bacterium]